MGYVQVARAWRRSPCGEGLIERFRSRDYDNGMYMGRYLQAAALILLPIGMLLNLTGNSGEFFGVNHMVYLLAFGIALFCMGRILENHERH
ncbi:hypothetical protein [Lignipirellula cremea]|uniref:Uncharacterized protein n=1 Tax=Lignipirellula cremea TaxID=2528010 RepID=A0A518DNK6_9BACT|nr:hypothetical protein [Lignipirellula cremea]QDU93422.1 hypothetical protein Pla8534_12020 [Lignipirellula cremea]